MKALKYSLALVLGLSMLGWNAQVQAQAQTQTESQNEEQPQRGIPTPKAIETLVDSGNYETAVKEFDKFIKTAKGSPCDMIYLPLSFYQRLRMEDTAKPDFYQGKVDFYLNEFLQTCGNTVDGYLLKESVSEKIPDSTIVRMTKAIALERDYAMLYTMRGDAFLQLQRMNEACADFAKAKELGDEYAAAVYNMNCSAFGNTMDDK